MNTALAWFTARRRQAIYVALGSLTVLLVAMGVITDDMATDWLDVGQKLLAVLASLIAIANLTPDVPVVPDEGDAG